MTRHLVLNAFLTTAGMHSGSWRRPGSRSDELLRIDLVADLARSAERAGIDAIFIADSLGLDSAPRKEPRQTELEPITMLAALAMVTDRIGLIGTASTSFTEPFNLSRYFSALDHISGGRAAWNIVTSTGGQHNFGVELPSHAERYAQAHEYVEVVKALWDSWEDDAVVDDAANATWVRADRVHEINHKGRYYDVRGPAHIPRSPQGWPVLVQAGSSADGMDFAAAHADIVFTAQTDLEGATEFAHRIDGLLPAHGRSRDDVRILPGLMPILGATEKQAQELAAELAELVDPDTAMVKLKAYLPGVRLDDLDLDDRVPAERLPPGSTVNVSKSRYELFRTLALDRGHTVRQLLTEVSRSHGHGVAIGTPEQVADLMQKWYESGACDGFNLGLSHGHAAMPAITDWLVPELRDRGLLLDGYRGATLRDQLGLPRPERREA